MAMRAHLIVHRVVAISVAIILAGALVGMASGVATASVCVSWAGSQPPNPSSSANGLGAVAAVTPCDVWAVGLQLGTANQTLTEHWNGVAWTVAPSANPGGPSNSNTLSGVAVRSPADGWAVGDFSNGSGIQTLIETLSGGSWKRVPSVSPAGPTKFNVLQAVAIVSASNAWAVGLYDIGAGFRTLIEHWNGHAWQQSSSPNKSAIGDGLAAVAASSARDVWAVGSYNNPRGIQQTLIERWNGITWKLVPSPDPGGSANSNEFTAVAASSASNAWAVGTYNSHGVPHPLIAHWNGKAWRQVGPSTDGSLSGVTIVSAKDAWAVGSSARPSGRTLIAHWNGKTWAKALSPDLGSFNEFNAVAASSAGDIWAVGAYSTGGPDLTLAMHCC
jgi:hypothetical protein